MENEDARRESALAKLPILQPDFKPVGVSQSQKNKFQKCLENENQPSIHLKILRRPDWGFQWNLSELHRRRLQIKSKFNSKKKHKGNKEFEGKDLEAKETVDEGANFVTESSSDTKEPSLQDDVHNAFKKRKLYWGFDTKERWERKSNM